MSFRATSALLLLLFTSACNSIDAGVEHTLVLDTIGDTIVAQPRGAGAWGAEEVVLEPQLRIGELDGRDEYTFGEIGGVAVAADGSLYVIDHQASVVRHYDPLGRHIESFGRSGSGPGELKQPNGLALLRDGRVIVRDPGNARMNVYSPAGEPLDTWQIPGGYYTSDPVHVDTAGFVYIDVIADRRADGTWRSGLLKLDTTGVVRDTLRPPFSDFEAPLLKAERVSKAGSSRSFTSVPFAPTAQVAWSPHGYYVGGITSRYAIDAFRPDGKVFRIVREYQPVTVQRAERAAAMERITRNLRNVDPDWRWNGAQPPDEKPAFRGVSVAADGRIWVRVSAAGEPQPADPDAPPHPGGLPPLEQWSEPALHDVFEPGGRYLGRVRLPDRFTLYAAHGERVCGVERDELGVEYVVCYRLVMAG